MTKELDKVADVGSWLSREPEVVVVYDENAAWVAREALQGIPEVKAAIGIRASEGAKTLEGAAGLSRQLLEADVSREALLLAISGGVTTDLAGFVASIYKRGIRYANLPTTLLSQVDAAIGGKTGVNLDGYKNELGSFCMPVCTFLCPEPLKTLPEREWRCGMAELLKTFLIADAAAYRQTVSLLSGARMPFQTPQLAGLVRRAAAIKEALVQEDPYDRGVRMKLNLGHTFAHALEAVQGGGQRLKHGEAVAVGMVLAARLSERLGMAENGLSERLEQDFAAVGLPVQSPVPPVELLDAMRKDKKAAGGKLRMVLPVTPGEVMVKELEINDLHLHTT